MDRTENELMTLALDICFKIHRQFGPGLFESVYEELFCYEWSKTGIPFKRQQPVPLIYEKVKMEIGYRADVILESKVILEFKSIESVSDLHYKQLLTYLRLAQCKLGAVINFNTVLLKDGIKRIANNL
jgi:GxxExxY protein